jgi:hypothetical protein
VRACRRLGRGRLGAGHLDGLRGRCHVR